MARKGENIFKRKDGRWEGRYIKGYENGKAVYGYIFGKSYSEAKKRAEKICVLSSEEEKKLTEYLKQNLNPTSPGILLSLYTGIRLGELCALKWSDFLWKSGNFMCVKPCRGFPIRISSPSKRRR